MKLIRNLHLLYIIVLVLLLSFLKPIYSIGRQYGTIHKCVQATLALATTGNGQEANSCAGCDPAVPICSQGCQNYITNVYWDCDSVCLPDGYYFDPQSELSGCFSKDVQFQFKIKVERCGCNFAFNNISFSFVVFISLILFNIYNYIGF